MTAPVTITTDAWIYKAVLDTTILTTAFVTGRVIDEVTLQPLELATIRANRESVRTRVASGGYFAVSGSAARLFPDLATIGYTLDLTFRADRHRERVLTVNIPAGTIFPIAQGDVALRPLPVRLEGRVTREADRTGIASAVVAVKPPGNNLLLRTTAHVDHATPVNIVPHTINAPGALRQVKEAVLGGATVVTLDSVAGLAGNPVLQFGAPPFEYAVVDTIDAGAKRVTLRYPLTRSYALNAPVHEITFGAAGGPVATTRTIDAGDGLLSLAGPLSADAVEISDGVRTEFHETNFAADADGFFAGDGIVGVPSLVLRATAGIFQPLDREWIIDSSRPVAALSFRLKT